MDQLDEKNDKYNLTLEEQNMTALEHNIKTKGENAYYYAHGRKYEQDNSQQGPVLMSGGEPILVQKTSIDVKEIKVVNKTTKIFDKYQFCDDDEYVEVEIKLSY